MIGLRRSADRRDNARLDQVRSRERELHTKWGLGSGQDGSGYRDRLQRLCRFLQDLKPAAGNDKEQSGFARLQRSVDACRQRRRVADADLQRLRDLGKVLKSLERGTNGQEETEEQYLKRLAAWSPKVEPTVEAQADSDRQQALDRILRHLGVEDDGPAAALQALSDDLSPLEQNGTPGASDARLRWKELVRELIGDWEWAYLQVLVHLARACLARNRLDAGLSACAQEAEQCLAEAIRKLECRGFFQPRTQGLYGLLAESILLRSKAENSEMRLERIQTALTYARRAIEIDPENVNERRVLIEILSLLGDHEEVRTEAEVALNLDAGPETLRSIGASFRDRAALLRDPEEHKKALQEAIDFFEKARERAESAPLDEECPLEQIETHGWAHYWLGLFEGERAGCDQAALHLRTAAELGFKPIESRIRLAWIYLDARAYDKAGPAFRAAAAEAERWMAKPGERASGEDQPLEELMFQAYLGAASLALAAPVEPAPADPAASTPEPEKSIAAAEGYLKSKESLQDRTDLQALLHEARGRARLARKDPEAASELETAVRLSPRSSACFHLACARLEQSRAAKDDAEKGDILAKAREAYQLAVDLDPWGHLKPELSRLDAQLKLAENPPAAPGTTGWAPSYWPFPGKGATSPGPAAGS